MVKDISRIYPMYHGLKSPRPIDAFTGNKNPRVYDLELTPDWHQVTLFNSGKERTTIAVKLHTPMVDGGLALDSTALYYVYDFWKDAFVGKLKGNATLSTELNSMACVMYAVRKVQTIPQLLSTNRHILQGWMELKDMQWNNSKKTLAGKAAVVAGEPFKIVIAANNWKLVQVKSNASSIKWENHPQNNDLKILVIENNSTQNIEWSVSFKK